MRWPWFRMYSEARTDRKLDLLTDQEFRIWFNLLCMASESDERGVLMYEDDDELAIEVARGDVVTLRHAMSRLVTLKMCDVTPDHVTFPNFEKRQQRKPSDRPEATRARKAKSRHTSHDVTPMSRPVTRVTPVEEEIREEKKKEKNPSGSKRNSRLEPEWVPSDYQITYAKTEGMSEKQIRSAADNFRDWAVGNGVLKQDWDATWRRWVRTDLERARASPSANGRHKPDMYAVLDQLKQEHET